MGTFICQYYFSPNISTRQNAGIFNDNIFVVFGSRGFIRDLVFQWTLNLIPFWAISSYICVGSISVATAEERECLRYMGFFQIQFTLEAGCDNYVFFFFFLQLIDFSTLYTTIPHSKLKDRLMELFQLYVWVIIKIHALFCYYAIKRQVSTKLIGENMFCIKANFL